MFPVRLPKKSSRGMSPDRSARPRPRLYDPYSLAVRPLPQGLRLFPHPKGISAERALRITDGVVS